LDDVFTSEYESQGYFSNRQAWEIAQEVYEERRRNRHTAFIFPSVLSINISAHSNPNQLGLILRIEQSIIMGPHSGEANQVLKLGGALGRYKHNGAFFPT
jgi:hypothetical protein